MQALLDYYRMLLVIRFFEERVEELFTSGVIQGTTHPAIGQEAIALGVCSALRAGDYVTSTHRGHAHFIARGGDPRRIMAELYGRATGYSEGRGGSQLMADYALGFLGGNGITGGSIPVATGAALSAQLRRSGQVAACFFGDGAANQGTFHEALNLAGIWKLPVIYVCENNQYAMSMPVHEAIAVVDIADRAAGYGLPGVVVDGNDLLAVQNVAAKACERARRGDGGTLIECKTYRLSGHSRGDQRKYRSKVEEETARRNDPIVRFRNLLRESHNLPHEMDQALHEEAREIVREAEKFAVNSPVPELATLLKGVFA